MSLTLVILAAGAGNRYGGLKPLVPLGPAGETLLEYSAYDALRAGFSRVVLVVRRESERAFRDRLDAGMARHVALTYAHQTLDDLPAGCDLPPGRVKPWGTVQALLAAEPAVEGPLAVANADDFYGADSFRAMSRFLREPREPPPPALAVVGFEVARTLTDAGPVSRALCRLGGDGLLRDIVELRGIRRRGGRIVYRGAGGVEQALDGEALVSMNLWGFPHDLLSELRDRFRGFLQRSGRDGEAEFLLPDAVRLLVREERARVQVLRGSGPWCGVTFPEDRQRVAATLAALVAEGRYPERLWAGRAQRGGGT